jgi:hypothetical protein
LIAPCRCATKSCPNATATSSNSNTEKIARRVEPARVAALPIAATKSAVSMLASRSAPTGPKEAAKNEPCVSEARNHATTAIRNTAPAKIAEVRIRDWPSWEPTRLPPKPPANATSTELGGAIVETKTAQARP